MWRNIVLTLLLMLIRYSIQKDKAKEKAHALQVLLRGNSNETYGGIIIFSNNITYRLVPEHKHKTYDHTGAAYYVVAVVLVYGLSIILLIASHIKRKHKKFVEDRQINRYLQAAPSLKEKSAKARWKELKMSFIPITLATVAIGNSISASEKHHLTTVSEETDDEVQELEAITIDTGYGNRQAINRDELDDAEDESICLLNDTCDTTDDEEVLVESTDCLSDGEGYTDSKIGNVKIEQQPSLDRTTQLVCVEAVRMDSSTGSGFMNKQDNNRIDNNDNSDELCVQYSSPVHSKSNYEDETGSSYIKPSPTHHVVSSYNPPVDMYLDNYNKQSEQEQVELPESAITEDTWVRRRPTEQDQDEQTLDVSRETQL